jgi:hypothetical protein
MMDLEQMMAKAKANATGDDLQELVPGVTLAEAKVAAGYAMLYGGFTTPEIEAPRIARDRARRQPVEEDEGSDLEMECPSCGAAPGVPCPH